MIWSAFSVYRFLPVITVMLILGFGPYYIHRTLTKQIIACDGFRLNFFSEPRAFISWSFDWPWWCEHFGYDGVAEALSGEEFNCYFSVEGPFFATICPRIQFSIHAFDIDSFDGEEFDGEYIARRLQNLRGIKCLDLDLSYSPMSDVDLAFLVNWENLDSLRLERTKVTDRGLEQLKSLAKLKILHLSNPETTPEGRNALRSLLPECKIYPEP